MLSWRIKNILIRFNWTILLIFKYTWVGKQIHLKQGNFKRGLILVSKSQSYLFYCLFQAQLERRLILRPLTFAVKFIEQTVVGISKGKAKAFARIEPICNYMRWSAKCGGLYIAKLSIKPAGLKDSIEIGLQWNPESWQHSKHMPTFSATVKLLKTRGSGFQMHHSDKEGGSSIKMSYFKNQFKNTYIVIAVCRDVCTGVIEDLFRVVVGHVVPYRFTFPALTPPSFDLIRWTANTP